MRAWILTRTMIDLTLVSCYNVMFPCGEYKGFADICGSCVCNILKIAPWWILEDIISALNYLSTSTMNRATYTLCIASMFVNIKVSSLTMRFYAMELWRMQIPLRADIVVRCGVWNCSHVNTCRYRFWPTVPITKAYADMFWKSKL